MDIDDYLKHVAAEARWKKLTFLEKLLHYLLWLFILAVIAASINC